MKKTAKKKAPSKTWRGGTSRKKKPETREDALVKAILSHASAIRGLANALDERTEVLGQLPQVVQDKLVEVINTWKTAFYHPPVTFGDGVSVPDRAGEAPPSAPPPRICPGCGEEDPRHKLSCAFLFPSPSTPPPPEQQ